MNDIEQAANISTEHASQARLVHALPAAVNAHDADRVAALYAEGYRGLDLSRLAAQHGRAAVRRDFSNWLRAFPDLRLAVHIVMAQPGRVALSWTLEGTHEGAFLKVPPTGRRVVVCGFSTLAIRQRQIARGLHLWDMAGLLRAMKLLPDLPGEGRSAGQAALLAAFWVDLERPEGK